MGRLKSLFKATVLLGIGYVVALFHFQYSLQVNTDQWVNYLYEIKKGRQQNERPQYEVTD